MSIVQIQLIDTNSGYLDLADGTNFPINFGISDVADLTQRKGTTTKTIRLSDSKNNNKLLNNYFDVNVIGGSFDINKLQKCIVIEDGIIILDNVYLQLTKVIKSQTTGAHDHRVSYECVIKDSASDFFTRLGNSELTDLQMQTQKTYHLYSAQNVVDSWNNTWEDTYKYILPVNTTSNSYALNQLLPGIFAKSYFNKIVEAANFTYEWEEHTGSTQQFDKLIIPFNGTQSELTTDVLEDLKVIAENNTPTEYTYAQDSNGDAFAFELPTTFPTEIIDTHGYYNPAISRYTNDFYIQGSNVLTYEYEIDYQLILRNQSGSIATSINGTTYNAYIKIQKNSNVNQYNTISIPGQNVGPYTLTSILPGDTIIKSEVVTRSANIGPLLIGDYHNYKISVIPNNGNPSNWDKRVDIVLKINSIKMKIVPKFEMLEYNLPVYLNTFVPKKIKQSDFFKSFIIKYNLFIETDKNNPKKLIIKSRDKFYDDGKEEDWTDLLCKELPQEMEFLPDLKKKKFKLTDKQDESDAGLVKYLQTTSKIYGEAQFTYDNEYTKDVEIKETIFSPTISVNENTFGAVTPLITGPNPKNNIRLLIDAGMFPCNSWNIFNYGTNGVSGMLQYPLFSSQNSPTTPTFDINFGQCGYYASGIQPTNNNMYNLFWRRTLNQMNTSKMLVAYFNLKASDIQKMRLSDKIRIDNSWWNINKIVDYNPTKEGPTKVELLSIDSDSQFSKFQKWETATKPTGPLDPTKPVKPVIGSLGSFSKEIKKIYKKSKDYTNIINGNIGFIDGSNNFIGESSEYGAIFGNNNVSDSGGLIIGDDNTSNSNSFIFGNGNIVPAAVGNATIFGNNVTADTSNTMYASNFSVVNSFTIQSGATFVVSGVTFEGLDYLPLTGGTMTGTIDGAVGFLNLNDNFFGANAITLLDVPFTAPDSSNGLIVAPGLGTILLSTGNAGTSIQGEQSVDITCDNGNVTIGASNHILIGNGASEIYIDSAVGIGIPNSGFAGGTIGGRNIITNFISDGVISTNTPKGGTIVSSQNSSIDANVTNSVIIGGQGITASTNDTVYVPNLNIKNIGAGSPIINLGLDASGNVVTGGTNSGTTIALTYSSLASLKASGGISKGIIYHVTDRNIFLIGLGPKQLSLEGSRIMLCPLNVNYIPHIDSNPFAVKNYLGIYGQTIAKGSVPNSSSSFGGTTYYAIWGGKLWKRNETGADTPGSSQAFISAGWTAINSIASNSTEEKSFNINYDFDNDWVSMQSDWKGNVFSNKYIAAFTTNPIDMSDWNNEKIYQNTCRGIYNNYNTGDITKNSNKGIIYNNKNNGDIIANKNDGDIYFNSNNGEISKNTNSQNIYSNTNGGVITFNSNYGVISSNSNTEYIALNSNLGDISNNSNTYIKSNSNNGYISNNSNDGSIAHNHNNGSIESNKTNPSKTMYIQYNMNNGLISNNVATNSIFISQNTNNGYIGSQSTPTNRTSNILGTVVDK